MNIRTIAIGWHTVLLLLASCSPLEAVQYVTRQAAMLVMAVTSHHKAAAH